MKPIPELDTLPWSEPREVGAKKWIMKSAPPSEAFWNLYRRYKDTLKAAGISVSSFKDVWSVNWWQRNGAFEYPVLPELPTATHREIDIKPLVNETNIKPFQIPLVQHMVAVADQNTINGSGTGVGKTFITCAMERERQKRFLVICPKAITVDWKRAASFMDAPLVDAFGWEWIKTGKTPYGCWEMSEPKRGGKRKRVKFHWTLPDGVELIFDEAHRASGNGTQNSHIVEEAAKMGVRIHALSATLANDPTKLKAIGFTLGLHDGSKDGFEEFMRTYGCQLVKMPIPSKGQKRAAMQDDDDEGNGYGQRSIQVWKFRGTQRDLQSLHSNIFPHKGVRVKPEDLGDAFPETQIDAKAYELDEAADIRRAYEEMQEKINEIEASDEYEGNEKSANILAEMMRARKRVEFLKINLVVSLTRDAMEEDMSVFIAVNFRETLFGRVNAIGQVEPGLVDLLKIKSLIVGGQKDIDRRNMIDDFQADKNRICAGIIQACREGLNLHDLHGKHPRQSLIMPSQSAIDTKQVLGRIHRAGGVTRSIQRILFAANTIEEAVCKNLATKLDQLDLLMDGDLSEGIFPGKYSHLRMPTQEQGVML